MYIQDSSQASSYLFHTVGICGIAAASGAVSIFLPNYLLIWLRNISGTYFLLPNTLRVVLTNELQQYSIKNCFCAHLFPVVLKGIFIFQLAVFKVKLTLSIILAGPYQETACHISYHPVSVS